MVEVKDSNYTSILEMCGCAILEKADIEAGKIIDNILDVNTDPKKKRRLTLTCDFVPTPDRTQVALSVTAKSALAESNPIQTTLTIGANQKTGEVIAVENIPNVPGQMGLDGSTQQEPKMMRLTIGGR